MSFAALPVTLRQLQYLVAVADLGGFRRAAEACHVAQPSLSAQVALAEDALGIRCFERDRRRVRLVPAAIPILDEARRIVTAVADLGDRARLQGDPLAGAIRIGLIPTVCPYLLPEIAGPLARALPRLSFVWSEDRTAAILRQVREGALDAALVALGADLHGLASTPVGWDPFLVAAAPGHRLLRAKGRVRPAALRGVPLLLLEEGHCFRDQALAVCGQTDAADAALRATSLATLVQMASASGGATLLPALALRMENPRGQLRVRRFIAPGPGRTLVLVWRRGSPRVEALSRVASRIRQAFPPLRQRALPVPDLPRSS